MKYIVDAGVENINIAFFKDDSIAKNIVCVANDRIQEVLKRSGLFRQNPNGLPVCDGDLFITGKLSEIVRNAFGSGTVIMPAAALWSSAKQLIEKENNSKESLGIIDISASGYMTICVDRAGELIEDGLVVNTKCGAGSGINLSRILEKLDIGREKVDEILFEYIGEAGKEKRGSVPVRSDRCGVFSSSATISDKNQGIPLDFALAITMKSEILKACRKAQKADVVYLTGRVFKWQYARDCALDYFREVGVPDIRYDAEQTLLINGVYRLSEKIGRENFRPQNRKKLRKPEKLIEYPSFSELKIRYESDGIYTRLPDENIIKEDFERIKSISVNMGLDVGSTMAKMAIADAESNELLFVNSYNNHGDTIETIKHMFSDLCSRGAVGLNIRSIGITGSGRYQVQKSLQAIYPDLGDNIFTLVENYAHSRGSAEYAREHIDKLMNKGIEVNNDFYILVDIGGEDTKISIVALGKNELFDNAMNIKCSAGTGSLMDTLKALFGIEDIRVACQQAFSAPKAYNINATCAVFLMENARKMQASGYGKDEILASCNYAIVENMARTLWTQVEFPHKALVLLHGQTMLSDPLPLAVTHRVQEFTGTKTYCLVPPLPGHRACIGLLRSTAGAGNPAVFCDLNDYIGRTYTRRMIVCKGAACGDPNARCARTRLISAGASGAAEIKLTLGGCTAVNEMYSSKNQGDQSKRVQVADSYRELWDYVVKKLPRSDRDDRLVIPRSFAVSEQAYFFSRIFERLGLPVHCDDVREEDILNAQPLFAIDTCAPNIGASGQFTRLAGDKHSFILVPQIDYLPTKGLSLGRTCTTNQGGVAIAMHFAKMKHPDSRFLFFDISLKTMDPVYITDQVFKELQPVFQFYGREISKDAFIDAVKQAHADNLKLLDELSNKAADYIEEAVNKGLIVSIICAREYILNPGIYDSHIGKLMRDKGVIALPSYALEVQLDEDYGYVYWKNPHDILSKIDAIAGKRLNEIVLVPRLKQILRKIEHGLTDTQLSVVQVSTFRCGPDSVTVPTTTELTKNIPSLFIQSDAMIKELAHLENRVNTHLNQITKQLHDELKNIDAGNFSVEILNEFVFDGINKDTDVLYFPTMSDNRMVSSVMRAAGITAIDNYEDESYDLVSKVKTGRRYAGDSVCVPLSAVYADMLLAVEDFIKRKNNNDPLVQGKSRILTFMNGGDGPCRLGQYVDVLKLLLYRQFKKMSGENKLNYPVKILINMTSAISGYNYNYYIDEWVGLQGFHAIILQAIFHILYMKGSVSCGDNEEYSRLVKDVFKLKQDIYSILEKNTRPGRIANYLVKFIERKFPKFAGIAKYFGYGLYNNNGLRKPLKRFSKKWINRPGTVNPNAVQIYLDGEVYVRVAQIEELFKVLIDEFGFRSFELNYTPVWSFLEYILENRILVAKDDIKRSEEALRTAETEEEILRINAILEERKKFIGSNKGTVANFRNVMAGPLYRAAGLEMPHPMEGILREAEHVLPTLKPHGELAPYVGEAITKLRTGTDLFLNAAPEGCMVSSMGEILTSKIMKVAGGSGRVQYLFSTDGEIDEELLLMAFLKRLGPERYYRN